MNSTMNLIIGTMLIVLALWVWRQVWADVCAIDWRRLFKVAGFGLMVALGVVKVARGLHAGWVDEVLDRRLMLVFWLWCVACIFWLEGWPKASPAVRWFLCMAGAGIFTHSIVGEVELSGLVWPFPGWVATVYLLGLIICGLGVCYEWTAKGVKTESA